MISRSVIPGRCEASDPESRDSGFGPHGPPRNDYECGTRAALLPRFHLGRGHSEQLAHLGANRLLGDDDALGGEIGHELAQDVAIAGLLDNIKQDDAAGIPILSKLPIIGALFKSKADIDVVYVPYKGSANSVTDLMAGRVQFMFATIPSVIQHIQAGRLKPSEIITHRFPLEEVADAYHIFSSKLDQCIKPVLIPPSAMH